MKNYLIASVVVNCLLFVGYVYQSTKTYDAEQIATDLAVENQRQDKTLLEVFKADKALFKEATKESYKKTEYELIKDYPIKFIRNQIYNIDRKKILPKQ